MATTTTTTLPALIAALPEKDAPLPRLSRAPVFIPIALPFPPRLRRPRPNTSLNNDNNGNGNIDKFGPHPGQLFDKEVVRPEKRLRPFIGNNEQLLSLTRWGRRQRSLSRSSLSSSGGGAERERGGGGGGSANATCGIDRRLLRENLEANGEPGQVRMRSSILLPPVDIRATAIQGRGTVTAVDAAPSAGGPEKRAATDFSGANVFPQSDEAGGLGGIGSAPGMPDVLSRGLRDLPDMSPAQTNDANLSAGLREYAAGNHVAALSRLDRAIEQHHSAFVPRFVRGLCRSALGRREAALRDFGPCCDPRHTPGCGSSRDRALAHFNRSVVRAEVGDVKRAVDDLTAAISLNCFDGDFYANRALLLRRRGEFEAAQRDYRALRRIVEADRVGSRLPSQQERLSEPIRTSQSRRGAKFALSRAMKQSVVIDPHVSVFGHVHMALACPAEQRTEAQLSTLVRESKMMPAFVHVDEDELLTLWRYLEYRKYPSNMRIFEQDDPAEVSPEKCVCGIFLRAVVELVPSSLKEKRVAILFSNSHSIYVLSLSSGQLCRVHSHTAGLLSHMDWLRLSPCSKGEWFHSPREYC